MTLEYPITSCNCDASSNASDTISRLVLFTKGLFEFSEDHLQRGV